MKKKKPFIISIVIATVLLIGIGAVFYFGNRSSEDMPRRPVNTVDYSGPSNEEAMAGDEQKATNEKREKEIESSNKSSALDFRLSDAAQYGDTVEVRAYLANILEDGTCLARFTKSGAKTVMTTSTAFRDANTTQCGGNDTPATQFSAAGEWNMTLTYTSQTGKTADLEKKITIKKVD